MSGPRSRIRKPAVQQLQLQDAKGPSVAGWHSAKTFYFCYFLILILILFHVQRFVHFICVLIFHVFLFFSKRALFTPFFRFILIVFLDLFGVKNEFVYLGMQFQNSAFSSYFYEKQPDLG